MGGGPLFHSCGWQGWRWSRGGFLHVTVSWVLLGIFPCERAVKGGLGFGGVSELGYWEGGWWKARMEKVLGAFKPKPSPQEQLREWQRKLRQESRDVDRQVREIQREEKNVQKAIKEAAKRNDMKSAKSLARELVSSRKVVTRLYENRAQLNSISMHLGESVATARAVGHLQKSTEVMKLVNNLMKAPEIAATMQELSKEMMKAGVMEEMVNDGLDSALDNEDMEEEIEEEVDKVLEELAVETTAQLPASAAPRVRVKPTVEPAKQQQAAVAEGGDDDDELDALRARLDNVRS